MIELIDGAIYEITVDGKQTLAAAGYRPGGHPVLSGDLIEYPIHLAETGVIVIDPAEWDLVRTHEHFVALRDYDDADVYHFPAGAYVPIRSYTRRGAKPNVEKQIASARERLAAAYSHAAGAATAVVRAQAELNHLLAPAEDPES